MNKETISAKTGATIYPHEPTAAHRAADRKTARRLAAHIAKRTGVKDWGLAQESKEAE